jgi:hypothetical protein
MNVARTLRWSLPAALLAAACATSRPPPAAKAEAPKAEAPTAPARPAGPGLHVEAEKVIAPVRHAVLSGFNFSNGMAIVEYLEDFQAVKPAELRFPGGNIGDDHDLTDQALGIFQANLNMVGNPPAVIQTRVFQGGMSSDPAKNRPEDAAENVRVAKAKGIKVRYWEIGNEPDLFSVTRGDPSWTPQKYCDVFRAQAAAIKAVDPAAKIAGPAVSGARGIRENFLAAFVKSCGDVVDVLTWHIYPTDGQASDEVAFSSVTEADETIRAFTKLWKDQAANPKGFARPVELGITEYGLSWFSQRMHHLADMPAAIWAIEMAFRFNEQGVTSAHYFALHNMGGHSLMDQSGFRRPTYWGFRMLASLSGNLVPATTGDEDVWAHAARDGDRLDVILSNKAMAAKAFPVALPGFTLREAGYVDEKLVKAEEPMASLPVAAAVTLPPQSIVHLVYGRDAAAK